LSLNKCNTLKLTRYNFVIDQINNDEQQSNDQTILNDDFREECENCKHDQELAGGYDDIFPEPETMTLERWPQSTHEHAVNGVEPRSSMTLPSDGRLRRYLFYIFELHNY